MKITKIAFHPMTIDNERPVWTAHERFNQSQLTLVEIQTDEGIIGIGEIAAGPQAVVCEMLALIGPVITAMDPMAHLDIWKRMLSMTYPRPGGLGDWDGIPFPLSRHLRQPFMAAMAGIDIALWDIKGKALGQPVFRILGGTQTDLFTYAVGGFYVEDGPLLACADELAGFIDNGFRGVKLKTGALSLHDEVARVKAVREAIGPDILFMIDMNAPYDVAGCIAFSHAIEPYDIFWLEEPLHWYLQPSDYIQLAAATSIPLAHGEREMHRYAVRDFIDSGAIRYIQFDATRSGGFTEAHRIASYAEQKGVKIAPHTAAHIHAHLASPFGDAAFGVESVGAPHMHPIHHRIFSDGAIYREGRVHLSEEPGFSLEVDWRAVKDLIS